MTAAFVTHLDYQNQIQRGEAATAILVVSAAVILLSLLTLRKNKNGKELDREDAFLTIETSLMLRGAAILLLLLGHFVLFCVKGAFFFEAAGNWAVMIFLFISGVALTKRYGMDHLEKGFFQRRIGRLLPPTWIALIVFYLLDFTIRHKTYSPTKIVSSFLGLITPAPPNGPDWFITYILFLYLLYYLVSKARQPNMERIALLFLLSYGTTLLLLTSDFFSRFDIWTNYTIVFPLSVAVGIYRVELKKRLAAFFEKARTIYLLTLSTCLYLFCSGSYRAFHLITSLKHKQLLLAPYSAVFISALLMITYLADTVGMRSMFLMWLGEYSFEIFLIHLPFMINYDFLLFHKPLYLFSFLYLFLIFTLSYALRKTTTSLTEIFRKH